MKTKTSLSIHQPNFIPWLGYFNKIKESDVFIILDTVQYPRGKTIANKNKIFTKNGIHELVIPVSKKNTLEGRCLYTDVEISSEKELLKMMKTIESNYSKHPFFDETMALINKSYSIDKSFTKCNIDFIVDLSELLDITTKIKLLSTFDETLGMKNQLIRDLCNLNSANVYLSGMGAAKYNDEIYLSSYGITLMYQDYSPIPYKQLNAKESFEPNLSSIDALMNLGFDGVKRLI
jgi:hypothetical protein